MLPAVRMALSEAAALVAAGKAEAETVSAHWHAWWREHNSSFTPPRPAPCRDW